MNKIFTLFLSVVFAQAIMAATPTVPSSSLNFPASRIDGDRIGINFNKGNGAFRIVVVKEGSPITTAPVNGTDYPNANSQYGVAGTAFNGDDGFVVYCGSHGVNNVTVLVTGLQPGKTYYVSIWELNGSSAATEYLATSISGSASTKAAPTSQATITSFTNVAGNRFTLNFNSGNGEKTLLLARKGSPVNAEPEQLKKYIASAEFGKGNVINGDNYVVYQGSGSTMNISDLEPNTVYHFAAFAFNGTDAPVYLTPAHVNSRLTNAGPTQASGNISFVSVEGNRFQLSFSVGNGKHQLIIGRKGQPVTAVPQNGQVYEASADYGEGYMFPTGDFVLNSTGSNRIITQLDPSSTYYFRVYDFDMDAAGNTYYLTSSWSEKSGSTAFPPTTQPSGISFDNITGSSVRVNYTAGLSSYRLIVVKAGSPVDAVPEDLRRYNGNASFGQGEQVAPGNFVIHGQTNSNVANISGLSPGVTYYIAIFGFNGNNYPVYGHPPATDQITIPNEPGSGATNFTVNTIEGNSMRVQWNGGDGAYRLVVARKGAPVSATPLDGVTYTADKQFQHGDLIGTDNYVVFNGTNRVATVENLEPGSTYHFAIFEYNLTAGVPDYLTSAYLQGSEGTLTAPTSGPTALSASEITGTQARISFTPGNGRARLFIMRAGSPVNVEPVDLVNYEVSSVYGTEEFGSTGNYLVQEATGSTPFNVFGLTPNTRYYVTAFEYNGNSGPVFLRPGTSFDFTTAGSSGTVPPTVNASNPGFSLIDGNKLTFTFNKGDGAKRIVVMRAGSAVDFTPVDGVDYTVNSEVVYNGGAESVTISDLQPATTYHFAVFEYNGTGTATKYLVAGHLAYEGATAAAPAAGSTNLSAIAGVLDIKLSWTSGPGSGRLVVMKEGSAVNGEPANLSKYLHDTQFKNGSQIATGEFVVYRGSGSSVTVTGLEAGKTYHYTIFEYNGVDAPVYNIADAISGSTTLNGSLPLKWLSFTAKPVSNGVQLNWSTTEEVNTAYFVVERNETPIDTIQAKGNAVRNDYSFLDGGQHTGHVFYRIKQVDMDGRYEYSKVVMVNMTEKGGGLNLYPNPAPGIVHIQAPGTQATVRIYSQAGVLVKTLVVNKQQQVSLPAGVYYVVTDGYSKQLMVR